MRNHLLIAGTGRAGTSVLVQILDACGLETEISRRAGNVGWHDKAKAGIETVPILGVDHPYVVKSPWAYQFIGEMLARPDIQIDGAIIPVRDLSEAAASRVILELVDRYEKFTDLATTTDATWKEWGGTPGGVTYSLEPLDQARILAHSFHQLIEQLTAREIPIYFIHFPRFVNDLEYMFRCLTTILPKTLSLEDFKQRIAPIVDRDLVRAGSELAIERKAARDPPTASNPHASMALPKFEDLDRIALKRELRATADALRVTKVRDAEFSSKEAALVARCEALLAERSKWGAEVRELNAELKHASSQIAALLGSTSWKITHPLRQLVLAVRGRKP
jgi:hypothetical protein